MNTIGKSNAVAWMNGQLLPVSQMALPVWDLGVVAGASITEMARTFGHKPFLLPEHLDRLLGSCQDLTFEVPWSKDQLIAAADQVIQSNIVDLPPNDDLGIVIFVTAGANRTYLGAGDLPGPTVGVHTFRLPFELWKSGASDGIRLIVPERTQISQSSLPVSHKTRNRLHWWLADREANERSPGSRALLLDESGFITETSTACFYAVIDGTIVTPRRNVLNSMSRRLVQAAALKSQIPFEFRDLRREDFLLMSETFVSSTPFGILPVRAIDKHTFPVSESDSVVPTLLSYWHTMTGICPRSQILDYA